MAAIAGLAIACVGFLWANRLLPLALDERAGWELRVFFGMWLLALALLCLLLPVPNWMTTGDHLVSQIAGRGDWESAGVELTVMLVAAWAAVLRRRKLVQPMAHRLGKP